MTTKDILNEAMTSNSAGMVIKLCRLKGREQRRINKELLYKIKQLVKSIEC